MTEIAWLPSASGRPCRSKVHSPPQGCKLSRPYLLSAGRSTPINTLAPSSRACAITNGINRRSRRYMRVENIENGSGDNARKSMNFASKVNGMKACCNDHANATSATARLVLRERTCPVQELTGCADAGENECQAHRNKREAEQSVAAESPTLEADEVKQADVLAAGEAPQ